MTTFTKTISVAFNLLGGPPCTRWGSSSFMVMTWGVAKWGFGSQDTPMQIGKYISETLPVTGATDIVKNFSRILNEIIVATADPSNEALQDGSGYNYVFKKPSINAEDRNISTWVSSVPDSESWTSSIAGSTTWS